MPWSTGKNSQKRNIMAAQPPLNTPLDIIQPSSLLQLATMTPFKLLPVKDLVERQRARLAAIRISYADGQTAEEGEIDALRRRFPALDEARVAKLRDGREAILQVEDGDILSTYRRLSPQESLDAHAEMISWIHLHDDNQDWLEFAADRDATLKESGIDPEQMLPIVGGQSPPDCYVLRLDGGAGERGAVYLWSHEESANFEKVVDTIDEIFPDLADCGRQGFHCL
jgi:hypothetical protein